MKAWFRDSIWEFKLGSQDRVNFKIRLALRFDVFSSQSYGLKPGLGFQVDDFKVGFQKWLTATNRG